MQFEEYLASLPLLHSWDGGVTWTTGGFTRSHLETLYLFLHDRLPERSVLLETGAGNSTIMFQFLKPAKVISIAPDPQLFERIKAFCQKAGISDAAVETHVEGSQWVLPRLAADIRNSEPILDFALIDGCHGWPTAFVDLEYIYSMLRQGGYLMIDDVQLHAEKEIARLLSEHPAFSLELDLGKSLVFRKVADTRHLGEWSDQPYIVRRTKEYARRRDPYALTDPSRFSDAARQIKRLPKRILGRLTRAMST
jgi:precorrin-6B methylase 2